MKSIKTYTPEEAKRALEHYCIYQDRCNKEVEEKLSKMRLIPEIIKIVITHLIAENFLNETRFSQSFARGKFRIKKWGKVRIIRELKFRYITAYNIKIALKEINEEEYLETLDALIQKKIEQSTESNHYKKRKKITDYLLRQGYESSLIYDKIAYFLK
jgi:regulatory protein